MSLAVTTPPFVSGALPLVGHALEFMSRQDILLRRGYAEHGQVFALRMFNNPVAVLTGPENQKYFFTMTDKTLDMEKPYAFLAAIFGKVAFLGPTETYTNQRPVLHALFGREQMARYLPEIQTAVQEWLDRLGEAGEMELTGEMIRLVQEVAGRCFLGREVHERLGPSFWRDYTTLGKALDPILPPHLPLPKFIRRDRAKARIRGALAPIIAERRAAAQPPQDGFQLLLDHPQKDGSPLADEVVDSMIMALMFAGHETTAGQAAWSVIHLLQNPEYLGKVKNELNANVKPGEAIDHVKLREMEYTRLALEETSRVAPSTETLFRAAKEDIQLAGYTIPRGWLVQTATAVGHYLPDQFSDAETYDPLRYSEDRNEGRQAFANITFGGGIHKCAGMNFANAEMAIILALMFSQFELELLTKEPRVARGLGASRPTKTWVRYKRKQ